MAKKERKWLLNTVMADFITTAMEELRMATEQDWSYQLQIKFLGEEGVDEGGPRREFFSFLFNRSSVFEKNAFCVNSSFLANKDYVLLGRATALAIVNGHPGPKRFAEHLVNYMLSQREPEECLESDVGRTDVLHIVQKLQSEVEVENDSLEMLYAAGFRKQLSESTVKEARTALLLHFGFYIHLGPLLQYMDGNYNQS